MSPRHSEPAVIAVSTIGLIEYGVARGLARSVLMEFVGEPVEVLRIPGQHIPVKRLFELLEYIMRELDDPSLPFAAARQISMDDLHIMGFAVMTATDGLEATRRAVRYTRLLSNSGYWEMNEGPEHATLRFNREISGRLGERAANEAAIAHFVHCSRSCAGYDYTPSRVSFRHEEPPDTRPHRDFFRCPVEFGAPHNEFVLSNEFFERVPLAANPAMSQFFREHAEKLLQEQEAANSLQDQVRREIAKQLPTGQPTLTSVAKRLAMSERSLRRHLTAERASFSHLLSEVRFQRARSLLRSPSISLSEIAYLLGFSNVSAFSRAFKKWCGSAPGEFREALG